jgi:hypothetical protein
MANGTEDARFVVEKTHGFHEGGGPWEGGKVGFAIGEQVFWTGNYSFPGDTTASHAEKVAFAMNIIMRLNHGRPAKENEGHG